MLTRERVVDAPAEATAARPPTPLRRLWGLPLWAHAVAAAAVLVVLIPIVGLHAQYSADEGAALAQARHLADGGGWLLDHPMPEVDPELDAFPLQKSEYGSNGIAAYAKHPLYPLLLAGALAAGGLLGVVLLSITGTVVAAAVAAAIAGRLDRSLSRPVLWVTALVSPLLFDAYLAMAHSLAAATAGGAVLCALAVLRRRSAAATAACVALAALTVLLRTEGVFLAAAVAIVFGLAWLGSPRHWRLLLLSIGTAAGGVAALLADRAWWRAIVGVPEPGPRTFDLAETGFVDGRIKGFVATWIQPAQVEGGGSVLLLAGAAVLVLGAVVLRRRPGAGDAVRRFGLVGVALLVVGAATSAHFGVPGLLPAFPLLFVGLALVGRPTLAGGDARVLAATAVLFSVAVILTQYAEGGSAEWGGRYFALALPLAIPLAADGLRRAGAHLGSADRHRAVALLAVGSVALSATAVGTLRSVHDRTHELVTAVADRAAVAGEETVVVTTVPALPRLAWERLDERRWLLVEDATRLDTYLARLHDAGVGRVVLAGPDDLVDGRVGGYRVASADLSLGRGWVVATLSPAS